jgi:hypothetical protein
VVACSGKDAVRFFTKKAGSYKILDLPISIYDGDEPEEDYLAFINGLDIGYSENSGKKELVR